jgi:uncharacterized OB-fold protein
MEAPRHWRLKKPRYALIGEKCPDKNCPGETIFPPRDICPHCGINTKKPFILYEAPKSFEVKPYTADLAVSSAFLGLAPEIEV